MLRADADTDDVSHDPFSPGQGIDDLQLPGRLDWSLGVEYDIENLVCTHLKELGNARGEFTALLHSMEDRVR